MLGIIDIVRNENIEYKMVSGEQTTKKPLIILLCIKITGS